jgi:hypothetical protein
MLVQTQHKMYRIERTGHTWGGAHGVTFLLGCALCRVMTTQQHGGLRIVSHPCTSLDILCLCNKPARPANRNCKWALERGSDAHSYNEQH